MTPEQHDIFNVSLLGLVLGGLVLLVGLLGISNYRRLQKLWAAHERIDRLTRQRDRARDEVRQWIAIYDRDLPGQRADGERLSLEDEYREVADDPDLADLVDALAANDPKENPSA